MRLLCLNCGTETTLPDGETIAGCPACGDRQGVPADLDETATITLTTHELRILTMWADNWARHTDPSGRSLTVVRVICDRLATQTPAPLTLSQELADLRSRFGDITVVRADGTEDPGL